MDPFGRNIDYLRISVTDRCNERCLYCLPEGYRGWQRTPDHLSAEEVVRIVRVAADLGFRKFRLTGGEPLVRKDTPDIIRQMASIPGVECIGLSTNGTRLETAAPTLRAAGLRTVNISLDALDPKLYFNLTGGNLSSVLAGIRAAVASGFECIKLNCVLLRGINESEIWPLVLFSAEHRLPLRLIELMPFARSAQLSDANFFSVTEAMRQISARDEMIPQPHRRLGWGPAKYYLLKQTGALVGFIGSITTPHFCDTCNKIRLTADGKVRPCLGQHGEVDLRTTLRNAHDDDAVRAVLLEAIRQKPFDHQFREHFSPCRPMTAIGG